MSCQRLSASAALPRRDSRSPITLAGCRTWSQHASATPSYVGEWILYTCPMMCFLQQRVLELNCMLQLGLERLMSIYGHAERIKLGCNYKQVVKCTGLRQSEAIWGHDWESLLASLSLSIWYVESAQINIIFGPQIGKSNQSVGLHGQFQLTCGSWIQKWVFVGMLGHVAEI